MNALLFLRLHIATTLLLTACIVATASGQQQLQLPPDLPRETVAALQTEIAKAREAGLPTEPLVLKALEGWSKGATHAQIVGAVSGLRERLRIAAGVFGTLRSADVLDAAAAALYAGVDVEMLRRLSQSTKEETVGMALVVLGDLIQRGVPVGSAQRAVLSLSAAGADARALNEFRRIVDDDIRTGLAPVRAAEVRLRGMLVKVRGSADAP